MNKRCFGYLRVSGLGQVDRDGFPRQREAILAWAKSNDYEVVQWFQDGGVSGEVDTDCRDGYSDMMAAANKDVVSVIVVERSERLARNFIVGELCLIEARDKGLKIVEAASGTDLTATDRDPTSELIRQILGVVAQWQKNVMVKRLSSARRRRKEQGFRVEGRKPFADQTVIRRIVRQRDVEKRTFRDIARLLRENKICAPQGQTFWWEASTVRVIYLRATQVAVGDKPNPALLDGLMS